MKDLDYILERVMFTAILNEKDFRLSRLATTRFKLVKCKYCGRYYSDLKLGFEYFSLCCDHCIKLEVEDNE